MNRQMLLLLAAVVLAWGLVCGTSHAFMPDAMYQITDLGSLGGGVAYAECLNVHGQIAGRSYTVDSGQHAFLYSGTEMIDLSTLGGRDSYARGINADGHIVGSSEIAGSSAQRPFLYDGSTMTDLNDLVGGTSNWTLRTADDINDAGQITGNGSIAGITYPHGFLYDDGNIIDLGSLGGRSIHPSAINASGQVVGRAETAAGAPHAFFHDNSTIVDLNDRIDPFSGWTLLSEATDINDAGIIVGRGMLGEQSHTFLYDGVTIADLGALDGESSGPEAINNHGYVVGSSSTIYGERHAFLYDGTTMIDLNERIDPFCGWVLRAATDINDAGVITGYGTWMEDGRTHAFRLDVIPEPSTFALLISTAWGLVWAVSRRSVRPSVRD